MFFTSYKQVIQKSFINVRSYLQQARSQWTSLIWEEGHLMNLIDSLDDALAVLKGEIQIRRNSDKAFDPSAAPFNYDEEGAVKSILTLKDLLKSQHHEQMTREVPMDQFNHAFESVTDLQKRVLQRNDQKEDKERLSLASKYHTQKINLPIQSKQRAASLPPMHLSANDDKPTSASTRSKPS